MAAAGGDRDGGLSVHHIGYYAYVYAAGSDRAVRRSGLSQAGAGGENRAVLYTGAGVCSIVFYDTIGEEARQGGAWGYMRNFK